MSIYDKIWRYVVSLFYGGLERIVSPFEIKEFIEIDLVFMLNVLVKLGDISEHVMHVVLG